MTITKLTGQELLDYIHEHPLQSHTEKCTACGYLKELKDGSQGCDFTSFFEAIFDARKANGEYKEPQQGSDWFDSLTERESELYHQIEESCPEFAKLDAEQCQEFMDELSENGITMSEQFDDAYFYQSDSTYAEAEFAEYIGSELECLELPSYIIIDWQATWDRNLRHDFFTIEFDGITYFFHSNF